MGKYYALSICKCKEPKKSSLNAHVLQVKAETKERTTQIETEERTKQLAHRDSILTTLAKPGVDRRVMHMFLCKELGGEFQLEKMRTAPISHMPDADQMRLLEGMGKQPTRRASKQNNDLRHCHTLPARSTKKIPLTHKV